jgi:hypothetical protein
MAIPDTTAWSRSLAHDRVKRSWVEYDGVQSYICFVKVQVITLGNSCIGGHLEGFYYAVTRKKINDESVCVELKSLTSGGI